MSSSYVACINFLWFAIAFWFSRSFLTSNLFVDYEIKSMLNKFIFSTAFGLCVLMLIMFLQEVLQTNDIEYYSFIMEYSKYFYRTSLTRWKLAFLAMDFLLLILVPISLFKTFFSLSNRKKMKNKFILSIW